MEYFGLKDKDGKDVKLVVTDDPYVHPHPIIRVESIVPDEPKELPKTVEELGMLLHDFRFAEKKEQTVNQFLRERGYKTA